MTLGGLIGNEVAPGGKMDGGNDAGVMMNTGGGWATIAAIMPTG
jgi:hypothetical protein